MATKRSSDIIDKALQDVARTYLPDRPSTEVVNMYDNCRYATYDETISVLDVKAHKVVADAMVGYLSDNREVKILDVAAGTGLVAVQLKALGFHNIDALDPSEGMLNVARQKNVYKNVIQEYFPIKNPSVKTSSYDVLVISLGLSGGHMGCDSLPEMVRCAKTGGFVIIAMTEKHLTNVAEYRDRLEPLMQQLEREGQWQILERTVINNFHHTNTGVLFVFKVTKAEN